jgi:hypothetical protein
LAIVFLIDELSHASLNAGTMSRANGMPAITSGSSSWSLNWLTSSGRARSITNGGVLP